VQGTVWFAAHVVAVPFIALYVLFALRGRRPLLAGLMLGCAFMTRPSTMFLALVFAIEALDASRRAAVPAPASIDAPQPPAASTQAEPSPAQRLWLWWGEIELRAALPRLAWFAAPLLVIGGLAMWMNAVRFDDPFEFGHSYLRIRWTGRIEKWGLANYHYLAKNLAVFLAGLPWISAIPPYLKISRHGLALWLTTPAYLGVLWPKRTSVTTLALALAAAGVALVDLCYQNSGWIQFGYRFSLDYAVLLIALLALGGRKHGTLFHLLLAFAIAVNLFGAITFDRVSRFYDQDPTQQVIFQPD
jgi:hypothetical protein